MSLRFATPGQKLGPASDFIAGDGVYEFDGFLCASTVGNVSISTVAGGKSKIEITRKREEVIVPQTGNVVLCRVVRISPRHAVTHIICVGEKVLKEPFFGLIRKQDVRATEIDKVEIVKCFRPSDIVRAEVLSPGDARSFLLSTAKNELGVVLATSIAGELMIPVSWQEMECPRTHMREFRKVAKITISEAAAAAQQVAGPPSQAPQQQVQLRQ